MNKLRQFFFLFVFAALLISFAGAVHAQSASGSDEFFVVSSVEKGTLILLRPTEITAIITVTDKTQIVDEQNKPLKLTDLRTGDTIFVNYSSGSGGTMTASHVRKGMMTVAELRKRYETALPAVAVPVSTKH
jgi:hypothetical protein